MGKKVKLGYFAKRMGFKGSSLFFSVWSRRTRTAAWQIMSLYLRHYCGCEQGEFIWTRLGVWVFTLEGEPRGASSRLTGNSNRKGKKRYNFCVICGRKHSQPCWVDSKTCSLCGLKGHIGSTHYVTDPLAQVKLGVVSFICEDSFSFQLAMREENGNSFLLKKEPVIPACDN